MESILWHCKSCDQKFSTPDGGLCSRCNKPTCLDCLHRITPGAKWVCKECLTADKQLKASKATKLLKALKALGKFGNTASCLCGINNNQPWAFGEKGCFHLMTYVTRITTLFYEV